MKVKKTTAASPAADGLAKLMVEHERRLMGVVTDLRTAQSGLENKGSTYEVRHAAVDVQTMRAEAVDTANMVVRDTLDKAERFYGETMTHAEYKTFETAVRDVGAKTVDQLNELAKDLEEQQLAAYLRVWQTEGYHDGVPELHALRQTSATAATVALQALTFHLTRMLNPDVQGEDRVAEFSGLLESHAPVTLATILTTLKALTAVEQKGKRRTSTK